MWQSSPVQGQWQWISGSTVLSPITAVQSHTAVVCFGIAGAKSLKLCVPASGSWILRRAGTVAAGVVWGRTEGRISLGKGQEGEDLNISSVQ